MAQPKGCVGCGFCCRKALCAAAARIYGVGVTSCPALEWDGSRYWCKLCKLPEPMGPDYRKELAIGDGCCCGLNSDRQNIPPPVEPASRNLPRELQVFLRALGREFIGRDAILLALYKTEKDLGEPGFTERCMLVLQENRPRFIKEFMG